MLRKLLIFWSFHPKKKLLLLEASIYLGWARIQIRRPFSKIAPSLGELMGETPTNEVQSNNEIIKQVSYVIGIASRYTLWESKCLVRAIAAMKMLERRCIESTLYLGTAKDEQGELIAHAWLRSGPFYITGADVMDKFTTVQKFAKKCGDKRSRA